jgi:hypothetical protein
MFFLLSCAESDNPEASPNRKEIIIDFIVFDGPTHEATFFGDSLWGNSFDEDISIGLPENLPGFHHAKLRKISDRDESKTYLALFFDEIQKDVRQSQNFHSVTRFPLFLQYTDYWGYLTPHDYSDYQLKLKNYLKGISSRVALLDLRNVRLPKDSYWVLKELDQLETLLLPYAGVAFYDKALVFSSSIKSLTVFNSRLNTVLNEKNQGLSQVESIRLVGCWYDTKVTYPYTAAKIYAKDFDNVEVIKNPPLAGVRDSLRKLILIDCDDKTLLSTLYSEWPRLEEIHVLRSYEYTVQDGITNIEQTVPLILNQSLENYPKLKKLVIGSFNMNETVRFKEFPMDENETEIRRWQKLQITLSKMSNDISWLTLEFRGIAQPDTGQPKHGRPEGVKRRI